jgi:hypothetical protein
MGLYIPEILCMILKYVKADGDMTLFEAIQVNRQWFECGIIALWGNTFFSGLANLAKITRQDRRQIYASEMCTLALMCQDECGDKCNLNKEFEKLQFTKLDEIQIYAYAPGNSFRIDHYLKSVQLQVVDCCQGEFDDDFVGLVTERGACLRELSDSIGAVWATNALFDKFSGKFPSLETVSFSGKFEGVKLKSLMAHLASLENLKSLTLLKHFNDNLLVKEGDIPTKPFCSLKTLDISVNSNAVQGLVKVIPNITTLTLNMEDDRKGDGEEILGHLSQLTELKSLELNRLESWNLSAAGFRSLGDLRKLQVLYITGNPNIEKPDITESDFDQLLSNLPYLRILDFTIYCKFSSRIVNSIAKHCPRLTRCQLSAFVSFIDLQSLPAGRGLGEMLPKLEVIDLVDRSGNPSVFQIR